MKILTKGKYYGAKKSEWEVAGIVLSEYDYLTPRTDWHFHENPYFMFLLQGNLYDVNKNQKTICPAGSLVFHNWQEAHFNEKATNQGRGFHLEFEREWFEERKLDIALWEGSKLIENPRAYQVLGKLYYEFKCQDEFSELATELLLLELCESMQTVEQADNHKVPPWVKQLKDLLHQGSESLSLKYLAAELGIHPVHLSRTIPKYLSTSLGEYQRLLKIKRSLKYLLNPNYSLTEVAYECGFSDQSHFTRTFKSYFQQTPKVIRAQFLK